MDEFPVADQADTLRSDVATFQAGVQDQKLYQEHHLSMRPATQLVCFDGCPTDPYRPAAMPLYQTATFVQPSASQVGPYDYTRSGNPTRTALETLVAGLESAYASFAFTSGMAALNAVTKLCKAGDEIIASSDLYGGMYRLLTKITALGGIKVHFVDTSDPAAVAAALCANTALIHVETPSNPLMKISPLREISRLAKSVGALVSVDNTMMSPHLQKPLLLGADLVIHSATKFLSGHSDVMAGVVCAKNETIANRIAFCQNAEGTALAPFDCWLLLRSIKTMALRVERAQTNAEQVAAFLARHPAVTKLHYPGPIPNPKKEQQVLWPLTLPPGAEEIQRVKSVNISMSHEAHRLHMTQSRGGGSLMSFETGSLEFSRRLVDAVRLFKITVSFGSCNSLIELPCALSHASIPADQRTLPPDLVRISIGIEDVRDILEDLERAFRCAASSVQNPRDIAESWEEMKHLAITDLAAAPK